MATDSRQELRAALVAHLKGDATLQALGTPALAGRVYSAGRRGVQFPYIAMPTATMAPDDVDAVLGAEVMVQIDTFSRAAGVTEAEAIMARIYTLVHNVDLSLATQKFVQGRLQLSFTRRPDRDGVTTQGVQRFVFLTHN